MRDAFGGAFAIKLFLVFIAIYIGFTAVALNYAKAFKVKNKIISYLENNEIVDLDIAKTKDDLEQYIDEEILGEMKYGIHQEQANKICLNEYDADSCYGGIVIKKSQKAKNTEGVYYTVSTYVSWQIPFLNKLLQLSGSDDQIVHGYWKISGQTRLIVNE